MATTEAEAWTVQCDCGVTVAEGTGPAPSAGELIGAAADLATGHNSPDHLGQQIQKHMHEARGGVHRLKVQRRVTEKTVDRPNQIK